MFKDKGRGVERPARIQATIMCQVACSHVDVARESAGDGSTKVDATHVHCLSNGVALLHEGMSPEAQKQSLDLFTSGVDGVLVTTVQSARSMSATASVIVVHSHARRPELARRAALLAAAIRLVLPWVESPRQPADAASRRLDGDRTSSA